MITNATSASIMVRPVENMRLFPKTIYEPPFKNPARDWSSSGTRITVSLLSTSAACGISVYSIEFSFGHAERQMSR